VKPDSPFYYSIRHIRHASFPECKGALHADSHLDAARLAVEAVSGDEKKGSCVVFVRQLGSPEVRPFDVSIDEQVVKAVAATDATLHYQAGRMQLLVP